MFMSDLTCINNTAVYKLQWKSQSSVWNSWARLLESPSSVSEPWQNFLGVIYLRLLVADIVIVSHCTGKLLHIICRNTFCFVKRSVLCPVVSLPPTIRPIFCSLQRSLPLPMTVSLVDVWGYICSSLRSDKNELVVMLLELGSKKSSWHFLSCSYCPGKYPWM